MQDNELEYCKCEHSSSLYTNILEWGEQDICSDCNKPVEDGFRYFNHYDGEDHVFFDEH